MLAHRASTNPLPHTTTTCSSSSSSASRPGSGDESQPRASSELGTTGRGDGVPSGTRTSFTDEAQACYNLLLILRNDTQHLISRRNDNLASLEAQPAGADGDDDDDGDGANGTDAGVRLALLACINESIAAATRSIVDLGPWLEKFRWPAPAPTTTTTTTTTGVTSAPGPGRRSLLPRAPAKGRTLFRKRSKSFSGAATNYHGAATSYHGAGGTAALSAEELFSWTLALTGQHTAVLVATDRLDRFLRSGGAVSGVGEEEVRRREGRASWWEQGRGEFENVELIQSLLAPRPRKGFAAEAKPTGAADTADTTGEGAPEPREQVVVPEQDDGRSETLPSEPLAEQSTTPASPPRGLTAPKLRRQDSVQRDEPFLVHRARAGEARVLSRTETFGPAVPASRRSRVATQPLPSLAGLHDLLSGTMMPGADAGRDPSATVDDLHPAAATATMTMATTITKTTTTTTTTTTAEGQPSSPSATSQNPGPLVSSPLQSTAAEGRPLSSASAAGSTYTPFTPHASTGQKTAALSARRARPSKTIRPVLEALDNLMLVSPLETESGQGPAAAAAGVSPMDDEEEEEDPGEEGPARMSMPLLPPAAGGRNDDHRPYLEYMARKQAVTSSRW